jgi:two-component system sensor histidine kinase PilS (NtrC family)
MERKRLVWFNLVRVVVVSLFLVVATVLRGRGVEFLSEGVLANLNRLLVATYLFSIASLVMGRFVDGFVRPLTYLQVVWDLLFVTTLMLITGGVKSPFGFLFLVSIINASVLLARREALGTALASSLLFSWVVAGHYYGFFSRIGLLSEQAGSIGGTYLLYTTFVTVMAFFLAAALTGYLAERARRSESALREKVIDLDELERLNSSIVANLASGLITITCEGRIRVFNRYAEQFTGLSQTTAYDRLLVEVIPPFRDYRGDVTAVRRGELSYRDPLGGEVTLGFNSAPLLDKEGERVGTIVNFQDLTHVKRIEDELQRADRLAAVGSLAARIAHEIRNPLASLSASAQLIAQRKEIPVEDQRLLNIIIREADRLSELIGEFLDYARPVQLELVELQLCRLVAEMRELMIQDPRFQGVTIVNHCGDAGSMLVDGNKIRQVLWNLLVNSAEAMSAEGSITIEAEGVREPPGVRLLISDTGAGINADDLEKIFEPFFTTKPGGSGLGLATVYRIIEAHGGTIRAESSEGQGTSFTIFLPRCGEL